MSLQQLSTVHKAIAAGIGIIVIGLLEYVTTSTDLEQQLEQLLPAPLVPVVPIILGGIGLTYHVWKAENYPPAPASAAEPAQLVPVSAPVAVAPVDVPAPTVAAAAAPAAIVVGPPTSFVPLPRQ